MVRFGVLQGGPLPCYIFVEFFGFVYKWPKFFFGLTGEIFFRPTKKRPSFTPMFITIVGTHLVKCPIHPAVDSLKKKSPFILEFPICLDPADSYLWRRVTVPEKSENVFLGTNLQACKLEESRLIFLVGNASHVKNDKMNKMNAKP